MNPRRNNRSSPSPSAGLSRRTQGGLTVAAFVLIPLIAILGSDSFRAALDFTTGVLSLVSLTASIAWGLIATDRLLLSPHHRLLAQAIHRGTATASLGFLLLHATVKVSLGHVALIGALIPFGLGVTGTDGLIGMGSLAGLFMVIAGATGAMRSALAGNIKAAGRWRALHMLAYPAWCFALMHGLYAGRPAATWVTTMYCLALASVTGAVSVRLLPRQVQRRIADRILALTGRRAGPGRAEEPGLRDMATSPLPGSTGVTAPVGLNRMNGIPTQRPVEPEFQRQSAFGQPRRQPRLEAPSPQLYEAPPPPEAEPVVGAGSVGAGTGISAAYRAVSLASDPNAPLAERIPMTEEIPVVSDDGPAPGMWPTPSPPPPAQAYPAEPVPPPATPSYDTPAYDPSAFGTPAAAAPPAGPGYDTGSFPTPSYDTGSVPTPTYDTGSFTAPAYDTGTFPTPSYGSGSFTTPTYESPLYDPPATSPYEATPSPYDTGNPTTYDETQAMPGPLFPPPAGEPWNAPAGDRP
ncbi:hypothetical protein OHA05_11765 [Streptomyces sp. NBC_00306]